MISWYTVFRSRHSFFSSTRVRPNFLVGSCCSIISFLCSVLSTIVCLFVAFILAIALSVHRITASDYPCGIVKPYLGINRNYSAILATLQITSYTLGVCIALLFTCQLHESLIKLYFKQFSIFQLFSWIKVKILISFAWLDFT
jgi:hypothetical protein